MDTKINDDLQHFHEMERAGQINLFEVAHKDGANVQEQQELATETVEHAKQIPLIEQAVHKITDEMEKNKNPYVQVIGAFLLDVVKNNEDASQNVLDADKTIMKSLEAMRKEAEKHKIGNCAVLTDEQGFAIVLEYFGISLDVSNVPKTEQPVPDNVINTTESVQVQVAPKTPQPRTSFLDVSLDDLL